MRYKEIEINREIYKSYIYYTQGQVVDLTKALEMMQVNKKAQKSNRRLGRVQLPMDGTSSPATFAHTAMSKLLESGEDYTIKIVADKSGIILDIYPADLNWFI